MSEPLRGDMERSLERVHHAEQFTLLAPYGGPAGSGTSIGTALMRR